MMTEDKIKRYVAEYNRLQLNLTNLTIYEYILLREGKV